MDFATFERHARTGWDRIPAHFKAGVDGLVVEQAAKSHPEFDEVFTMGECVTEAFPSDFGGPDTTRSTVVLYHGSFVEIARDADGDFDWEDEIWETLTHELQHHLESLAGDDALEDVDYAADQNFRRHNDESFDPYFFRAGEPLGDGLYRVEDEYFLERAFGGEKVMMIPAEGGDVPVGLDGIDAADVTFVQIVDGPSGELTDMTLVLTREQRGLRGLRAIATMLRGHTPVVIQTEATTL